jgi:hypothetical protein
MQTAGLSDRELVPSHSGVRVSHSAISRPRILAHSRFCSADSTALFATSVAAPSSLPLTNALNCQE